LEGSVVAKKYSAEVNYLAASAGPQKWSAIPVRIRIVPTNQSL